MFLKLSILFVSIFTTSSLPLRETVIGGCIGTQFGCCKNSSSPCLYKNCSSCPNMTTVPSDLIGGCIGTQFGCCKNSSSPCLYKNCSSCPNMTTVPSIKFV